MQLGVQNFHASGEALRRGPESGGSHNCSLGGPRRGIKEGERNKIKQSMGRWGTKSGDKIGGREGENNSKREWRREGGESNSVESNKYFVGERSFFI